MNRYRHYMKLAQSLLLFTGMSVLISGSAVAAEGCGMMGGLERHQERHARKMEQHHQKLHEALQLSAEQEPAWKKLMDSEPARPSATPAQKEDWSTLSTPERADKMLEMSRARQERMSEHVAALKDFYAMLTPEQKKTFEAFHAGSRGGMRGKSGARSPAAENTLRNP